jgi:hypothetical protein
MGEQAKGILKSSEHGLNSIKAMAKWTL